MNVSSRRFFLALSVAAGASILAPPQSGTWWCNRVCGAVPQVKVEEAPVARQAQTSSYSSVVERVAPSVVNVFSTKTIREELRMNPFFEDPLLRRFFGGDGEPGPRSRSHRQQGLGSGVIISQDGYILTNNHVVEGADEVKVALANSQQEYTAKVVGTDPPTDVAVLKIEAKQLPAATLADSSKLKVGDVVLAIGNPFGVGQTVTMGIVSAVGRSGFGIVDYEDFIQTDASINPGNSGGALADAQGRIVGINTAIISPTGANQGIGFAVPIGMARYVMEQIIKEGKVVRGYLGVYIQPLTPDLAKAFNLQNQEGALVGGVTPKSPAANAGLKEGDLIVEFNNQKVMDSRHLRLTVARTSPGSKIPVKVLRNGKMMNFTVALEELPTEELAQEERRAPRRERESRDFLEGVQLSDLDSRARRQLEIPNSVRGALVIDVDEGSAAFSSGLRSGDVILEVNRQVVSNAQEASVAGRRARDGAILLRVWSRGGSHYLVISTSKTETSQSQGNR